MSKICSVCGAEKPNDEFLTNRAQCKLCYSVRKKEYRSQPEVAARGKEYAKEYQQTNQYKQYKQQYRKQPVQQQKLKQYNQEKVQCPHCTVKVMRQNLSRHKKSQSCPNK